MTDATDPAQPFKSDPSGLASTPNGSPHTNGASEAGPGARSGGQTVDAAPANPVSDHRAQMILWFLAVGALLMIAARIVGAGPEPNTPGIVAALYVLSILVLEGIFFAQRRFRPLQQLTWPGWTWRLLGLAATMGAAYTAAQLSLNSEDPLVSQRQAVPLWLLAVSGALLVSWRRRELRVDEEPAPRWELLAVAGITLLALVLRVSNLGGVPYAIMGDETKFVLEANYINTGRLFKPFSLAVDGHWVLFFSVIAASMKLLGQTVEAVRLHSELAGVLTVLATYAVARQLWGRRPALIAAALLATYHFHLHFSRNAMNNVYDGLFLMLVFGCLWRGWQTGRRLPWLMAAMAMGLAQYFYIGGRLILIQAGVLGLFWLVTDRRRVRAQFLNIVLAVGVFATVAMPVAYIASRQPDAYMTRFNQVNVFQSGWLRTTMERLDVSAFELLWQQTVDTLNLLFVSPDGGFYNGQLLLLPTVSIMVLMSLLYLISRVREGPVFWLLSSLGLIVLFGGVLTVAPWSGAQRFLGTAPLFYTAVALFGDQVLIWLSQVWPRLRIWNMVGAAAVALIMIGDAWYYFVDYTPARTLVSSDIEWSMDVGFYLRALETQPEPGQWQVVCAGDPGGLDCGHSNIWFLAPRLSETAYTTLKPLSLKDLTPPADAGLLVFVSPWRMNEVNKVMRRYPSAVRRNYYGVEGELLFVALEVPAPVSAGAASPPP